MSKQKPSANRISAQDKTRTSGSRREHNRQRLLDAAISVVLSHGMAEFTSARIAAAAGLHKPSFYAHFKNVQECLEAVALQVAKTNARDMLVLQTTLPGSVPTVEQSRQNIEQLLRAVHQQQALYRLLARYQVDSSALGAAVREINEYVRERWVEHFWRVAVHFRIDARHFKEIAELADYVVSLSYVAIGRVLDGRATDLTAEAARVSRYGHAIVEAEMRRMSVSTKPSPPT
jgi:AcrR family transcriptional regulator